MLYQIKSLGLHGIGGYEVSVECYLSSGLPNFEIVGLPDAAVKEARERVRAAIKNSGLRFPVSRITVNLAPADTRKAGTIYDLPILVGILAAQNDLRDLPENAAFFGELSLSGELRGVPGALPMALEAHKLGIEELFVPEENASEASFAEGIKVYPVNNVKQLIGHFMTEEKLKPVSAPKAAPKISAKVDFSEVKGQENAKRALEIAAAGGHNVLMIGPPGSGKSMLARRLPTILPDMSYSEMLETTEIYSVVGMVTGERPVVTERPFRAPHHTISAAGLAGGGTAIRPGEISLAHNGVLFLDELPEFAQSTLEVLRQPMEDGKVTISRASGSVTYPSDFMLVCAMNPCKCGWYGHSDRCRCGEQAVRKYRSRISGPLLDRIDLVVEVRSLELSELNQRAGNAESSDKIRARVNEARIRQRERYSASGAKCNASADIREVEEACNIDEKAQILLNRAYYQLNLTARSYDKIFRVARTIADLDCSERVESKHIAEAIQYRRSDFNEDMYQ